MFVYIVGGRCIQTQHPDSSWPPSGVNLGFSVLEGKLGYFVFSGGEVGIDMIIRLKRVEDFFECYCFDGGEGGKYYQNLSLPLLGLIPDHLKTPTISGSRFEPAPTGKSFSRFLKLLVVKVHKNSKYKLYLVNA
jgi:hypothetical protein